MILDQLLDHLIQFGPSTQSHLAQNFALSEDGVDAMMAVWIGKGRVTRTITQSFSERAPLVKYSLVQPGSLSMTVTI
ncbi:FeoC-like transcriptional regulator [Vibrio sp. WXL103]|uniref:FeoC-like transcriptional regulator n=1 Tax=Vibrio sp. WXL103 TaxID=3450710 RepID=UPI003EC63011